MKKSTKNVLYWFVLLAIVLVSGAIYYVRYLDKAHSSFENYYAFRGCTKLLSKTDIDGTCMISSGQTIKIVKYQGKWFLDGDLPCGFLCF